MFSISFQTAILAIVQIFAMGAIGFCLVRQKVLDAHGLKLLSFLSINVCFPCFIFYQITHNFHPLQTPFWWGYPLVNISIIMVGLALTTIVSVLLKRRLPSSDFLAASSFHNAGYIPLLMAMALPLGEMAGQVYAAVILSVVGFDICLWSLGVWFITRQERPRMEIKSLLNPPLISMALAILLILATGEALLWEPLMKPIKLVGDAALALAMLVIGGNMALTNLAAVRWPDIGRVALVKLILLPVAALTAIRVLHLDAITGFVLIIQSCMPTAVSLSVIGRNYGTANQQFINQSIFFTHLICMVTVPVFLTIFGKLWGHHT